MTINLKEVEEVIRKSDNNEVLKRFLVENLKDTDDPITWYDILKKYDFFDPRKNPKPIEIEDGKFHIPFWNELSLLEKFSTNTAFINDQRIVNELSSYIDNLIAYTDEEGHHIDNDKTDWMIIKIIFNLPISRIKRDYVNYISVVYNSKWDINLVTGEIVNIILPKLIEFRAKNLLLYILDILLNYKIKRIEEIKYEDIVPLMDEFWFNEMFSRYHDDLYDICGIDLFNLIENKMLDLLTNKSIEYNIAQIVTIEDSDQNSDISYEVNLVKLIRGLFIKLPYEKIEPHINKFKKSDYSIFRRLYIYIINVKYDVLKDFFWSIKYNPLSDIDIKHELWELFSNNAVKFDNNQIDKIIDWIEKNEYYLPNNVKEDKILAEQIIAYKKKEWYYSLLKNPNGKIDEKYQYYQSINPGQLDHPGYLMWSSGVMIEAPYEEIKLDISQFDNTELTKYLNSQRSESKMPLGFFSELSIKQLVKNNLKQFTTNMEPFIDLKPKFLYDLFIALKEAWSQKLLFEWDSVFNFIDAVIPVIDKWVVDESKGNYKNWTIQKIAELIEEGAKNDNNSFDNKFLSSSANSLIKLDCLRPDKIEYTDRILDYVINSSKGALYSAMVIVSLKYARYEKKAIWINLIEDYYTSLINDKKNQSYEFFFIIGRYFINIIFLDKEWILKYYDIIFDKSNDEIWSSSFQGYLSVGQSLDVFNLLNKNGEYIKALKFDFKNNMIEEILMHHIANLYLVENIKSFKNQLMRILIENMNSNQISNISHFYWNSRDKLNQTQRELIVDLWKNIIDSIKDKRGRSDIYNSLSYLISIITQLNELNVYVLRETAKYMDLKSPYSIFTDNLLRLLEQDPKTIGEIYISIAENDEYPYSREESIKKIVECLFNLGEKEIANIICRIYANKGFLFLRDLFNQYNE